MPGKMERIILARAQSAARHTQSATIAPAHVLVGMIREEGGVAASVLAHLSLTPEAIMAAEAFPQGTRTDIDQIHLADDTQRLLELSVAEARQMNHFFISSEHLLLALLQQDSAAVAILRELGVDPPALYTGLKTILGASGMILRLDLLDVSSVRPPR